MEIGQVDVRYKGPAVRNKGDQVLVRQPLQGLPNRRPPQPQLLPQPCFLDDRTRGEPKRNDLIPDQEVGPLALRPCRNTLQDDRLQRPLLAASVQSTSRGQPARQLPLPVYRPYISDISACAER